MRGLIKIIKLLNRNIVIVTLVGTFSINQAPIDIFKEVENDILFNNFDNGNFYTDFDNTYNIPIINHNH
ncbi:hypothetical protein PMY12_08850 [Clostridium tertium]|jgi:hypothetical protein|nr:hypothetical protein [Clostridium tertium]